MSVVRRFEALGFCRLFNGAFVQLIDFFPAGALAQIFCCNPPESVSTFDDMGLIVFLRSFCLLLDRFRSFRDIDAQGFIGDPFDRILYIAKTACVGGRIIVDIACKLVNVGIFDG